MPGEAAHLRVQEQATLKKYEGGQLVETVTSANMYSVEVVDGEITKVTPIEEES
jgi:hypothetical protein